MGNPVEIQYSSPEKSFDTSEIGIFQPHDTVGVDGGGGDVGAGTDDGDGGGDDQQDGNTGQFNNPKAATTDYVMIYFNIIVTGWAPIKEILCFALADSTRK